MKSREGVFARLMVALVTIALPVTCFLSAGPTAYAAQIPSQVEEALSESFGSENYKIDVTDNAVSACVWVDGLAEELDACKQAGERSAQWETVKACSLAIAKLSRTICSSEAQSDVDLFFFVLDDRGREDTLLAVYNGEVTLDIFEGYDAAGAESAQGAPDQQAKADEEPAAASEPTMGERNALKSAQQYLSFMAFSYDGLVRQLEFEGYSHDEAVYAADNCGADWNEQAAKKAADYLDMMSFSRDGLIDQLEFEGFSEEQAVYGVEQNGY